MKNIDYLNQNQKDHPMYHQHHENVEYLLNNDTLSIQDNGKVLC